MNKSEADETHITSSQPPRYTLTPAALTVWKICMLCDPSHFTVVPSPPPPVPVMMLPPGFCTEPPPLFAGRADTTSPLLLEYKVNANATAVGGAATEQAILPSAVQLVGFTAFCTVTPFVL